MGIYPHKRRERERRAAESERGEVTIAGGF